MTDTPEVARIRAALAAGPTPGPWRTFDQFENWCDIAQMDGGCTIGDASMEDGEYVAACNPAAMTAVLDHIDAQAAEIERLQSDAAR